MSARMIQLIYHSASIFRENSPNLLVSLAILLDECLRHNPTHAITGMLAYRNSQFIQVLEGPENEVHALLLRISGDDRHSDLRVIACDQCTVRAFPSWSMGWAGYDHDLSDMFEEVRALRGLLPPEAIVRPLAQLFA